MADTVIMNMALDVNNLHIKTFKMKSNGSMKNPVLGFQVKSLHLNNGKISPHEIYFHISIETEKLKNIEELIL